MTAIAAPISKVSGLFVIVLSVVVLVILLGVSILALMPSPALSPQPENLGHFTLQYGGALSISPILDESASNITAQELRVIQLVNGHAFIEHAGEVNSAFRCLDKHGTWKSFKTYGFKNPDGSPVPTNLWICKDDDGKFYAIVTTVFEKISGNTVARLVTAYKIAEDLFPTINDFISYIGLKWAAREIPYIISMGETILEPFKP